MSRSRGQALTELALLAPLFAILLILFSFWARLMLTRLALVQLSRDSSILLARNGDLWRADLHAQLKAVQNLADRDGRLDSRRIQLNRELLPLPYAQALGLGLPLEQSPFLQEIGGMFMGRRYTFRYHIPTHGLAGRLLPGGLVLKETLAVHGDPWKLPLSEALD